MGRDPLRCLCLLLAVCALPACGGQQTRPLVLATYPAPGQVLRGPVYEVSITYDGPVRILNPFDVRVFADTLGFLDARVVQRDGSPDTIFVRPADGASFPLDDEVTVLLNEGVVVNLLDHYADEPVRIDFTSGADTPLLFGRPGMVTLVDPVTFAGLHDVPTPGGRDPVGLVSTIRGSTQRIWVQLDDGGGSGASMAWFESGDATMTAITLPAAADLVSDVSAIAVDRAGTYVYAAFRDTDSERVRVARIDTATATPAGVLDITAVGASASTEPVDLRWDRRGDVLVLSASDATAGVLAFIDRETFTEIDKRSGTPGIQGFTLPNGAGRFDEAGNAHWVALPGTSDSDVVGAAGAVTFDAGVVTGVDSALIAMPDNEFLVQGLAGYAGNTALQVRSLPANLFLAEGVDISDDVGGVDRGATSVVALQLLPGFARVGALLDSPGGLLFARFDYIPHALFQEDLDALTPGIQVVDVEAVASGATVIGRTFGAFVP